MLSPASLRVCCLAVMAPALTKADSRADCLPVVFSEPFCCPKTATSDNRNDKLSNEISLTKLPSKFACLLNKRRPPLMNKTWFRTCFRNNSEYSDRTRFTTIDLRKSLLNSKVRIHAESKQKTWHGTNATLAVADKVRLKYTMNKSNSSLRNMGLARTNTMLGLQGMRRMNRVTQLSHRDKDNPSSGVLQESGESSPDLPDSTNSELGTAFPISRIVQPVLEQSSGEVSSSGDLFTNSNDTLIPTLEVNHSLPVTDATIVTGILSDHCSIPMSPVTSDRDVGLSGETNLSVTLTEPNCAAGSHILKDALAPTNSFVSRIGLSSDCVAVKTDFKETIAAGQTNSCNTSLPAPSNSSTLDIADVKEVAPSSHLHFTSLPSMSCDVPLLLEAAVSLLPPDNLESRFSTRESDIETVSASCSFSSTSTLSANGSPIASPSHEMDQPELMDFEQSRSFILPDDLISRTSGATSTTQFEPLSYTNSLSFSQSSPSLDHDFSLFKAIYEEKKRGIDTALQEIEGIIRSFLICHVNKAMKTATTCFQKKFKVPCQRPAKFVGNTKSTKDIVDLKAELLQSEDVKHLSTAALVSLVRKMESGTAPGQLLMQQQPHTVVPEAEVSVSEPVAVCLIPEECADIKHTSEKLQKDIKNFQESVDPDLTESSDDEFSSTDTEESLEDSVQKRALWNFMKERAALASRSTWLIARIHELENQLRTITGVLKRVSASVGEVSFEGQATSALSASAAMVAGRTKPKNLIKPVNGCLDHSSITTTERKLSNDASVIGETCSRTRALKSSSFQKRKLLITTGLHLANSKLARLSSVGCFCNCQEEMLPCVLCTGRYNCIQSVDPDTLPLLERVALLDPTFHPLLSFEKDIPLLIHLENVLKKNGARYQSVSPASSIPNHRRLRYGAKPKHFSDARSRSRKLNRYARTLISAKYRNKKHFRKHKLVFGKWRKLQNKSSFQARERIRRISVASSGSSHDSPVPSPLSIYDDGFGSDLKRRRDDNQFDIDDVIIPYSSKRGRLVKFEFKDIEIPGWRFKAFANLESTAIEEDISDSAVIKRHEAYEIEERKIIRNGGDALCFFNTWQKRTERQHRLDSRADSSGANTPDPILLCDQDMFQDPNSLVSVGSPLSQAFSPPTTPSSNILISDDSQTAFGTVLGGPRKKIGGAKKTEETTSGIQADCPDVPPYEPHTFPLLNETLEELLAAYDHSREDTDVTASGPSCPASPVSTTSSTSTVDEDDVMDPEWTVVKRENGGPEPGLVLKFAKR